MAVNPNINLAYIDPKTVQANANNTVSTSSTSQGMDAGQLRLLTSFIQNLMKGGSTAQQGDRGARTQAIADTQRTREGFDKEDAINDAQGAMAAQMREALAKVLPNLVRSAEGAGTSQNALRALLTQKAAVDAADAAAQTGMKAIADYGQLNNQAGSLLQQLTSGTDPVQAALLQAFSVLKGANSTEMKQTTSPQGQAPAQGQSYNNLGSPRSDTGLGSTMRDPFPQGMSMVGNSSSYQGGLSNPGVALPNEALSTALRNMTF